MADESEAGAMHEQLPAFAAFLEKASPTQAGNFSGKALHLWLVGESRVHNCIVLHYDVAGIHVKDTSGATSGGPDTQFYPWHRIERVEL